MRQQPPIRIQRLINQRLLQPSFETPAEVVRWLGAVQAQDYLGALWAIGCRLPGATEESVERAIGERTIVRTWPMRGTIHFVPAEDAHWMVKLIADRVNGRVQSIYRRLNLDETALAHSQEVVTQALQGGKLLARKDLYARLDEAGIGTGDGRGLQIVGHLARLGLICFGPRQGKQPTFVLLDEWVPEARRCEPEDPLAEMALRYFRSHGPATIRDFAWWSGLLVAEAQHGLEAVRSQLSEVTIAGDTYWWTDSPANVAFNSTSLFLLPAYDEYLVSYKDRSASLDPGCEWLLKGENHLRATLVIDGLVVGNWKRTFENGAVRVETTLARELSGAENKRFEDALRCYGEFLGMSVVSG